MTTLRSGKGGHNRVAPVPEVSVVVPSYGRRERLRTLLAALDAQTLGRDRFEVIVVHEYDSFDGGIRVGPERRSAAAKRNDGWRAASSPLVAFVDDDCRPEPGWLSALLGAVRLGAFVQGLVRPDPLEAAALRAPLVRTVDQAPPHWYAQTANILYPRELLERLGGFDERLGAGEDIDLALRARAAGASHVAAPDAVVNHAVEALSLGEMVRDNRRWEALVQVVALHPELRDELPLGVFWRLEHLYALLALIGIAGRKRAALALAVPYWAIQRKRHGTRAGDRLLAARQVPVRLLADLAEVAVFAKASARYRTLVL
jgi:hypothetical protein